MVSVLMAVYSKEKPDYLRESINSLLSQTVLPDEIVIVKDGKLTQQLEETLAFFSKNSLFKIVGYDDNHGLGYALRFGVDFCSGDIIARMDSDDVCSPTRIEKEVEVIKKGYDLVGSNTIEFEDSLDNIIAERHMPISHEEIVTYSKKRNPFVHPSVMFKKDLLIKSGSFRTFDLFEDYDMWVRMIMSGAKTCNIDENLVFMRTGSDFFNRRGGVKYCSYIVRFFKNLVKSGYISRFEYMKTVIPRIVVSIVPGRVRNWFYKKKLRG